ncbi:2-polyprenyl-6-methoxyphenol hydroxylase and related FAD-dependent oxidoreductases [[Actinomadura] parvosata subsp. kistnae]|uniref:FAD-dependent oxidoreductase n=1 Tax=[Actinomadura] parvosata TaxID=1955412 RepID=UPI000D2DCAB4|nr:2-polyprenyl-6-methoxyphenol hydroxylase and related FAD-dependent oxidoreductases [Actinomadura parvosata subsp. kistnae]
MITPVPPSPATPTGHSQPSIAIVGASITGPVLALLLHQAGFTRVSVLEAAPTPYAQSGGVIGLDHLSLATLEALGIPQHELVPFPSEHVTTIHITDRRETRRTQFVYPGRNTGWHQLNTALLTRLPDGWLHPGHRVRALHPGDDGTAVLDLTGAAPLHADLVVFADGRRSLGRRLLDPSRPCATPATSPGAANGPNPSRTCAPSPATSRTPASSTSSRSCARTAPPRSTGPSTST